MDRDTIKALIEALQASDLTELEYSSNGEMLRLVKRGASARAPTPPPTTMRPTAASPPAPEAARPLPTPDPVSDTIVAPLFGVVHLQQVPDAPPLVSPGDAVVAGQVLCIIEAMKVFNQIRAERDGVIASVLVQSGQEVEAGDPLFRLG